MQKWEYLFAIFKFEPRGSILDRSKYDWLLYAINQLEPPKELKGRSRYDVFHELGMIGWELVQCIQVSEVADSVAMFKRPLL